MDEPGSLNLEVRVTVCSVTYVAQEEGFMKDATERDPFLEHAGEEAEGTELLEGPVRDGSLEKEREEAQGIEVFADPDATLSATVLREGSPGHEILTGDNVGLGRDDEEDRADQPEEDW